MWIFQAREYSIVALALSMSFFAGFADTVGAQERRAVVQVETNLPFSCSVSAADFVNTSACLGDAGSFQIARLGLAVEAFSSVLSLGGVRGDHKEIQSSIFADITKFGVHNALVQPAMQLVDVSSMMNSPFAQKSNEIRGKSLVALEYVFPGFIENTGLNLSNVSAMAKLPLQQGARDFNQYMQGAGLQSSPLDNFRIFEAPTGMQTILEKIVVPKERVEEGSWRNFAADFRFRDGVSLHNTRPVSLGFAFSSFAALAQNADATIGSADPNFKPNGASFVGDTPLGGAACPLCIDVEILPSSPRPRKAILQEGLAIDAIAAIKPSQGPHRGRMTDGLELMSATRMGGLARSNQQEAPIGPASEFRETVGNKASTRQTGSDPNTGKAESCVGNCALVGAAAHTLVGTVEVASDVLVGIPTGMATGDVDQRIKKTFEDLKKAQAGKTETGEYLERQCVQSCPRDTDANPQTPKPTKENPTPNDTAPTPQPSVNPRGKDAGAADRSTGDGNPPKAIENMANRCSGQAKGEACNGKSSRECEEVTKSCACGVGGGGQIRRCAPSDSLQAQGSPAASWIIYETSANTPRRIEASTFDSQKDGFSNRPDATPNSSTSITQQPIPPGLSKDLVGPGLSPPTPSLPIGPLIPAPPGQK